MYTLAIHYRLAPELAQTVLTRVEEAVSKLRQDLRLLHGKAVVEVKQRGFNKGTGLHRLMDQPPFRGRRPVFFGDDVTDEDALAALPAFSGLGVSVGRRLPGAGKIVSSPAEVRQWLSKLTCV